jgi:hypothetical protein
MAGGAGQRIVVGTGRYPTPYPVPVRRSASRSRSPVWLSGLNEPAEFLADLAARSRERWYVRRRVQKAAGATTSSGSTGSDRRRYGAFRSSRAAFGGIYALGL